MRLYCVRHGFVESSSGSDDPPLSTPGREALDRVAFALKAQKVHASHLYHSAMRRTVETATILAPAFGQPSVDVFDPLTENDSLDAVTEAIATWSEDTVLVGHMPMMSSLVSQLVIGDPDSSLLRFFPGTIVCLSQHERRWLIQWILRDELLIS